jgi:hypothetical protein
MYVRWQTYRSKALNLRLRECNDRRMRLRAVLVDSVRVDGKPRQKHVAYLGSIQLDDPGMITGDSDHARFWRRMSAVGKARFWLNVTRRLEYLGNRIDPRGHDRILAFIAEKVAPPTAAELEQFERERDALLAQLRAIRP